jgi:hypothetical protein
MSRTSWDERLMCGVVSLAYDFCRRTGQLYLPDGHCCDMTGCITLFQAIDPDVTAINTYSSDKADTAYRKKGTEWKARALLPSKL